MNVGGYSNSVTFTANNTGATDISDDPHDLTSDDDPTLVDFDIIYIVLSFDGNRFNKLFVYVVYLFHIQYFYNVIINGAGNQAYAIYLSA